MFKVFTYIKMSSQGQMLIPVEYIMFLTIACLKKIDGLNNQNG